jgi:hypothetical protein
MKPRMTTIIEIMLDQEIRLRTNGGNRADEILENFYTNLKNIINISMFRLGRGIISEVDIHENMKRMVREDI